MTRSRLRSTRVMIPCLPNSGCLRSTTWTVSPRRMFQDVFLAASRIAGLICFRLGKPVFIRVPIIFAHVAILDGWISIS